MVAICIKIDEFCITKDEFVLKMMNHVLNMMNSALKLSNFVLNMMYIECKRPGRCTANPWMDCTRCCSRRPATVSDLLHVYYMFTIFYTLSHFSSISPPFVLLFYTLHCTFPQRFLRLSGDTDSVTYLADKKVGFIQYK